LSSCSNLPVRGAPLRYSMWILGSTPALAMLSLSSS
jgi:hypothetical protein